MGKCVAYTVAAVTFMGIGALAVGLALFFAYPNMGRDAASAAFQDSQAREAECVLLSPDSSVAGTVRFMQNSSSSLVHISGSVTGLTVGLHGFHIHEFGSTENGCKAAGSHFNPAGQPHGGPTSSKRHVGDLGNIDSKAGLSSTPVQITDHQVTLYGDSSVLGRAIVIHAGEDDLGTSDDPSGAAGSRVACCTIRLVKTQQ